MPDVDGDNEIFSRLDAFDVTRNISRTAYLFIHEEQLTLSIDYSNFVFQNIISATTCQSFITESESERINRIHNNMTRF